MKKLLAILLVFCLVLPTFGAFAAEINEYNFEPFKITVKGTGSATYKRLVLNTANFPFAVTTANQLVGCTLNGTVTYSGTENYSKSVPFNNVEVLKSDVRTNATAIDFKVPDGYTIKSDNSQDKFYTWDLTLNPKAAPANDIPTKGSTFFVTPDMFSLSGNWVLSESDGSYQIIYANPGSPMGTAISNVKIPASGTYGIYSLARDYATNKPGSRYAEIEVNGTKLEKAGVHNQEGFKWEKIGEATFTENQIASIKVLSTSAYYARLAAIMFTTEDYIPSDNLLFETLKAGKGTVVKALDDTKTNVIILPDDFATDMGTWTKTTHSGVPIITGQENKSTPAQDATVKIKIPEDGTYYVWGYARDYTHSYQGARSMQLAVNGSVLPDLVGIHGAVADTGASGAFGWDKAGQVTLKKGTAIISAVDVKQYFARLAAVVLTTDPNFNGVDSNLWSSACINYRAECVTGLDMCLVQSYGSKLDFTFKNRTENAIENATIIAAIYDNDGEYDELIDFEVMPDVTIGAYKSFTPDTIIFEASKPWTKGKIMVWNGFDTMNPVLAETNFSFMEEDFANPDDDADANFGTVSSYMLDYEYVNDAYKGKEYNTRGGIYNTLKKLQDGEDITIGYLGGSITMQDSWRPYTTKWFEENYEGKVTEVNIGLSGTGADLAVCRIDQDVLIHNPDLVFIEYSVNGGAEKDMEGMIHKIWEHDPTTDIIIVHTTQTSNYSTYKAGRLPQYPAVYEPVAEHYGVPTVFFGYQAFDLYDQEKLTLSGSKEEGKILYTQDGVHMTGDGGFLAAGAIARCVVKMEETFNKETYTETNHQKPATTIVEVPWTDAAYSDDWSKMSFSGTWMDCSLDENKNFKNFSYTGGYLGEFKKLFPNMQGTTVAGSSVTVKFKGTDIGVFEAGGQFSGQLKVTVDGKDLTKKLVLYHPSYDSKLRHQYYFIDQLPYGEHTVTFTLDSQMPDKSSLQNKNPSDTTYQKNEFYLGKILMNGELLDINE